MCASVLVVEDDDDLAELMVRALSRDGHAVDRVDNGTRALGLLAQRPPDAVMLDLGLPDIDGLEVCRRVRSDGYQGGIVVVTARNHHDDVASSFAAGADDFLAKPFGLAELQARARDVLRHPGRGRPPAPPTTTSSLVIDRAMRLASAGPIELALTDQEFDVLALLAASPGAVVPTSSLLVRVWGDTSRTTQRMLAMSVRQLSRKLAAGGAEETIAPDASPEAGEGFVLHRSSR